MAATVLETTTPRKCFYSHYFYEAGAITKLGGSIYFISEGGEVTEVELSTLTFLVVLGEMRLADAQRIEDILNGGPAGVACSREEGRS
jgi:hypothetical protein